jgi:hypothetical protein
MGQGMRCLQIGALSHAVVTGRRHIAMVFPKDELPLAPGVAPDLSIELQYRIFLPLADRSASVNRGRLWWIQPLILVSSLAPALQY